MRLRVVLAIASGLTWLSTIGCTNQPGDKNRINVFPSSSRLTKASVTCSSLSSNELADFDRVIGQIIDLDHDSLPRGLYLASVSEVLLEKKIDATTSARLLAREVAGAREGEIVCAENMERISAPFSLTLMGLVKFDTSKAPLGAHFTARQFYIFSDRSNHGLVLSNPDVQDHGIDLKSFLTSGAARGQLVRVSDRRFELRLLRESRSQEARARLIVRLDLIPATRAP